MEKVFHFYSVCCFLVIFSKASMAIDTISASESLTDGMTLISNGGAFVLGFFSPGTSKNRYLGIWFNNIPVPTVVWVANRMNPINDSSGLLQIESSGRIVLQVQNKTAVWSAGTTAGGPNPVLQLLDSGNLVVRDGNDGNPENYLWQSFDYPTDTILPGMKLGVDLRTGLQRKLSAWKNLDDPSPGDLTYGVDLEGSPELVLWKGSEKVSLSGLWNGVGFSAEPTYSSNPIYEYDFVWDENEVYYIYSLKNQSVKMKNVLNQTQSQSQYYTWNTESQTWQLFLALPIDYCDRYGLCGPNANCDSYKLPSCQCLPGFRPKWPQRWSSSDYSGGCVHSKPLNCQQGDGFIRIANVKTPDTTTSWANKTMDIKECKARCLSNCSCMGYSDLYITGGGSGCAMWFGDLLNIKQLQTQGQDLNVRVSASQAEQKEKTKVKLDIILSTVIGASLVFLLVVCYIRRRRRKLTDEVEDKNLSDGENKHENEDMELAVFEFGSIAQATDSFSFRHKLGEGGFGPVYKGTLQNGQEIGVKRLSKSSGQGLTEFKNEVKLIAKLQHRNLVRLLGCCIYEDERMLVYEYMPNRSLDSFIFGLKNIRKTSQHYHFLSFNGQIRCRTNMNAYFPDQTKGAVLTWPKRFQIICGIARGLLYLHQDSRLRIIHRDLKTSNILLDSEMNPKISDFGLARAFGRDQTEANTKRVVGTYGYMAPEYAIDGQFSVKSDVFSFGILLLEIISGRKNRGFYLADQSNNLIEHAWRLWKEGKPLVLAGDFLVETDNLSELLRCIHIGLLCVQQHPEERPSMSSVVVTLVSCNELPMPKQPSFLFYNKPSEADCSSGNDGPSSRNEISLSVLEAR